MPFPQVPNHFTLTSLRSNILDILYATFAPLTFHLLPSKHLLRALLDVVAETGSDGLAGSGELTHALAALLDEQVIGWAMNAGVHEKVGFGFTHHTEDKGETVDLDDKLVLRCIAKKLGLHEVAEEKKRAIQFGSRSAKMESGRTKGTEKSI